MKAQKKEKISPPNKYFSIIIVVLIIVISYQYFNSNSKKNELSEEQVLQKVNSLIVLPQDEEPTVATITDLKVLNDRPFFKDAKDGFKVLIYPKAGKAVLYDVENNKIINIAPINEVSK